MVETGVKYSRNNNKELKKRKKRNFLSLTLCATKTLAYLSIKIRLINCSGLTINDYSLDPNNNKFTILKKSLHFFAVHMSILKKEPVNINISAICLEICFY